MILAVLEKRAGLRLGAHDVFVNLAGGLRAVEPGVDLAVALAVASSSLDRPFPDNAVAVGEIGLGGELRSVGQMDSRLRDAAKLGFTTAIVPARCRISTDLKDLKLEKVSYVADAIGYLKPALT